MQNSKETQRGAFIVIEGPDGSGKGYQTRSLARWLKHKFPNRRVLLTHEPWEGEYWGRLIRAALNGDRSFIDPANSENFQFMYVKNRIEHQVRLILKVLAEGGIVVCDRERLSTFAYGYAFGVSSELMREWHERVERTPDVIIYLETTAKTCVERMKARGDKLNYFDRADKVARVIKAYHHIIKCVCVGAPIIVVNNERPKVPVRNDVRTIAINAVVRAFNSNGW